MIVYKTPFIFLLYNIHIIMIKLVSLMVHSLRYLLRFLATV